ncbi:MAG: riboflavin synthase [Bacteroidetes bacterium]|nr:riboflavin synthase [Bacteroidota bacterium]
MFTGIIEDIATLKSVTSEGTNKHFIFSCKFTNELKIDQSLAHNGVCLTVVEIKGDTYKVTAIEETLNKTNLNHLQVNNVVNIERCMPANGRFDGHIVQGHVDTVAKCVKIEDLNGSFKFTFEHPIHKNFITVQKGSITINGVSLTVVDSLINTFSVCIIPYTFNHTSFKHLKINDTVNLEFDIIGKYVRKMMGGE